jgi:integrase
VIALNTGMRRNEILGLNRKPVDWANRLVTLTDTKNGETRHVYLNDAAFAALQSLPPRLDTPGLLPLGPNQVTTLFGRAMKRAGVEDFRLHDLRHTFASYQAMSGVAARGLQALLGHKDGRMTARVPAPERHLSKSRRCQRPTRRLSEACSSGRLEKTVASAVALVNRCQCDSPDITPERAHLAQRCSPR